ncbi:diguanylate cyclase (GGDEF)-like protein [Paenibacillus phyllosphaerae]|uniref:Diguanylate cyclase (GGDEF)-like protein n=1 Tax=Paenibacillus phyllosphaerae TaxID=274593 RepID=A0A7W5FRJ3_9BACL|nr:EAL domain-containing protein [Paenibacillus phyllosphaerae]MBB3114372.1 diguanylate cyclase (GGDEF)-like protein [Paenibacillus phyllosphaerae]
MNRADKWTLAAALGLFAGVLFLRYKLVTTLLPSDGHGLTVHKALEFGAALMQSGGVAAEAVLLTACLAIAVHSAIRGRIKRPWFAPRIARVMLLFLLANLLLAIGDGGNDSVNALVILSAFFFRLTGYISLIRGLYLASSVQESVDVNNHKTAPDRDELTGLASRRELQEQLQAEMARAAQLDKPLALILMDIDRFKTINDALGHSFGDSLLQAVSQRLRDNVNRADLVYRMGGDEFALLVLDLASTEAAELQAERLMGLFDAPIALGGAEYHITISVGLSFFPEDGQCVDLLIKNADTAMYAAKIHRNEYQSYRPEMTRTTQDRLRLESDLRKALETEQFTLAYQPLVNLATGRIVGVEALVRWQHPQRGLLPPGEFIPITEENGLILPLGEWVLLAACKQNKAWQEAGMPPIRMSVNLSMRQFRQHRLADRIQSILEQTGMPPEYLELEITESMTSDVEFAIHTLAELKALGVQISIDDFGTGYSSLGYLKRFPVDKLKIDRSFVTDLTEGGSDAAIVSTITSMAHQLKLKVTAEGVENDEQLRFLRERKCEEAQGYYFTKPIPANLFESWYRHHSQSA